MGNPEKLIRTEAAGVAPEPPLLSEGRRPVGLGGWRLALGVGVLLAMALGFWVLHTFPPDGSSLYPKCGLHSWTGLECPGCGSTRALHHLTHGRVLLALRSNALLTLGLPAALLWFGVARWSRGRLGRGRQANDWVRWMPWVAVLLVVFGVVRNLPWPPFTYLSP